MFHINNVCVYKFIFKIYMEHNVAKKQIVLFNNLTKIYNKILLISNC